MDPNLVSSLLGAHPWSLNALWMAASWWVGCGRGDVDGGWKLQPSANLKIRHRTWTVLLYIWVRSSKRRPAIPNSANIWKFSKYSSNMKFIKITCITLLSKLLYILGIFLCLKYDSSSDKIMSGSYMLCLSSATKFCLFNNQAWNLDLKAYG